MQIKIKNVMKTTPYLYLALPLVLGLTACRSVNTTERANPTAVRQMVDDQRIITDRSLDFGARVVGVNQANVGGDLVKVQVEIRNNSRQSKRFSYKFEWFDQNAMLIQAPAPVWFPKGIEGGETIDISAVAPNPQAKDFRLKLIEK